MNQDTNQLNLVIEQLAKSLNPAIVLPQNPSLDTVYAATGMFLALTRNAKTPTISCSQKVTYPILGVEKIAATIGGAGENLIISFPYQDGSIDKVDYRIADGMFNLIVVPREGFEKVKQEDVAFSSTGGQPDLIITIGVPNLPSIGQLYTANQQFFESTQIVNIDNNPSNNNFGNHNLVDRYAASMGELVFQTLRAMEANMDPDTATNLYAGIVQATDTFSSPATTALTLEVAGALLRLGAVKQPAQTQPQMSAPQAPRSQAPAPRAPQPVTQNAQRPMNPNQNRPVQTSAPRPQSQTRPPVNPNQQQRPANAPVAPRPQAPAPRAPQPMTQNAPRPANQPINRVPSQNSPRPAAQPKITARPTAEADSFPPVKQPKSWFDMLPSDQGADMPGRDDQGTTEKSSSFDERPQALSENDQNQDTNEAQDWLKPKIFNKGGGNNRGMA